MLCLVADMKAERIYWQMAYDRRCSSHNISSGSPDNFHVTQIKEVSEACFNFVHGLFGSGQ